LKGLPEGACLGRGFAVWVETPCASNRSAVAVNEIADPSESRTNVRRVKVIPETVSSVGDLTQFFNYRREIKSSKGFGENLVDA